MELPVNLVYYYMNRTHYGTHKASDHRISSESDRHSQEQIIGHCWIPIRNYQKHLLSGEDVMISGFGRFCVKEKKEHRGRNTATGEDMILKPRSVSTKATFKPPWCQAVIAYEYLGFFWNKFHQKPIIIRAITHCLHLQQHDGNSPSLTNLVM